MTPALVETLKHFLRPSSVSFLVIVLAVGVALAFARRTRRQSRWYFAGVLAIYWIGASPVFVEPIIRWQASGYRRLETAADARGAAYVVVLGSGNYTIRAGSLSLNELPLPGYLRVMEGARVYALLDRPMVIASGGVTERAAGARSEADAMRAVLTQLGVPADRILLEAESRNTREEAAAVARMLAGAPRAPIVLVTSPTHMRRSVAVFKAAGFDVVPSVAPFKSDHASEHLRWMPNDLGLELLDAVVYDAAATAYYWIEGWSR